MKLLKIGGLSSPGLSWIDGLDYFDEIKFIKLKSVPERSDKFEYLNIDDSDRIISFIRACIMHFNNKKKAVWIEHMLFFFLRIYMGRNTKKLLDFKYDYVHVSYNDFDDSAFVFLTIHKFLRKSVKITRAYKESRPEYSFIEKRSFELSDRIVLNDDNNIVFFKNKYGNELFRNKEIVSGLDEDYPASYVKKSIRYDDKYSIRDGKKHVVILAGRVFSSPTDERSGSRLYYLDLIKQFMSSGFIVHLHTMKIFSDENGINQYSELQKNNSGNFFIEDPLDLQGEGWKDAYAVLSRYDYGIIHNYIEGTSNTEFDKYNIAHRYYEYILAHVIPVIPKGKTVVMEKTINAHHSGIIYEYPKDIFEYDGEISFEVNTFQDYLKELYEE